MNDSALWRWILHEGEESALLKFTNDSISFLLHAPRLLEMVCIQSTTKPGRMCHHDSPLVGFRDRAFLVAAPRLGNFLPWNLWQAPSLSILKWCLKTSLFWHRPLSMKWLLLFLTGTFYVNLYCVTGFVVYLLNLLIWFVNLLGLFLNKAGLKTKF